ncbi:MAG: hypothetical protein CSA53_04055 [Gammaproteobacteria bacterium]|nr:MAG: hypothetical protein CSA53_04055 [Gammaproteobacteria bacterium]
MRFSASVSICLRASNKIGARNAQEKVFLLIWGRPFLFFCWIKARIYPALRGGGFGSGERREYLLL